MIKIIRNYVFQAFAGFYSHSKQKSLPAVCTGNWGCGAFGGDKRLKGTEKGQKFGFTSADILKLYERYCGFYTDGDFL